MVSMIVKELLILLDHPRIYGSGVYHWTGGLQLCYVSKRAIM